MYRNYFNFNKYPFCNTPDTDFFYESENHIEALSCLVYAINERKGFAVITGEIGSGKTIVSRKFLNKLDGDVEVGLIPNTCIREDNFLKVICDEFNLPTRDKTEVELLSDLNEYLLESLKKNKNVVLIIDESQNLSVGTLEKIRMLSNLETEKEKLLQIILLGQSELRDILNRPETEQIRQRINVWFHLKALNEFESREYIRFRLNVAGYKGIHLFDEQALKEIFEYSRGVPRIINTICDNALLMAFSREIKQVDLKLILEVVQDLGYSKDEKSSIEPPILKWEKSKQFYSTSPALVLASMIVVLGIFYILNKDESSIQMKNKVLNAPAYETVLSENVHSDPHNVLSEPVIESKKTLPSLVKKQIHFISTESELD